MLHVFGDHIGRTIEAHVDDIVVKTRKADDLVNDLCVAFDCLRANGVKLKATLAHAPILSSPQDGEPLYLYIAATTQVVSAVIVVEWTEEGHALPVQRPVYYISEVLSETKVRYP
jgi:hypothetical protein